MSRTLVETLRKLAATQYTPRVSEGTISDAVARTRAAEAATNSSSPLNPRGRGLGRQG